MKKSKPYILLLGVCAILFALTSCHHDHLVEPNRVCVPLTIMNGNSPRIYITVGGVKVQVIFDTGSFGLRILKGALKGAAITSLNQRTSYHYGGGSHMLSLGGEIVEANFGFGTLSSEGPIPFMLIDTVTFTNDYKLAGGLNTSNVTALPDTSPSYQGFSANLGVGLRADGTMVGSPITQMAGNGMYIVHFPSGTGDSGYILFNPTAADIVRFKNPQPLDTGVSRLPNGMHSYADDQLMGTLTISGIPYQEGTLLDTGNPDVWTESTHFPLDVSQIVATGSTVNMSIGVNPVAASKTFSAAKGEVQINYNANKIANSFGAQFFFDFDVLFDAVHGKIWIAPKS